MSEELYCPKCKKNVPIKEIAEQFHTCGCRVVPLYSEEMRKRYRAEERIAELKAQIKATENLRRGESVVNTRLLMEIERYRQAPNVPHIKGGTCTLESTHNACDCIVKQLAEAKGLVHHAADEHEQLKEANTDLLAENIILDGRVKTRDERIKALESRLAEIMAPTTKLLILRARVSDLTARLADLEWRSVEDELPGKRKKYPHWFSVEVLVFEGASCSVGSYNYEDRTWRSAREFRSENITHWMPLPAQPDSGEEVGE